MYRNYIYQLLSMPGVVQATYTLPEAMSSPLPVTYTCLAAIRSPASPS